MRECDRQRHPDARRPHAIGSPTEQRGEATLMTRAPNDDGSESVMSLDQPRLCVRLRFEFASASHLARNVLRLSLAGRQGFGA
jgi:hypothetical protein